MKFSQHIIGWYKHHKRDLPWRETSEPYRIWLSEIILQQTRVEQGLQYYNRFVDEFPDVYKLAEASEKKVLKLWQGLGYYSRARNLHAASKIIVEKYNGRFPDKYNDIIDLPGIGVYTASAIVSIAFGQAYPVVDGNVQRVIARLYGIKEAVDATATAKQIREILEKLIDKNRPDLFNQAMMEYGALVCKPAQPDCESCIFNNKCQAFKNGMTDELPLKKSKPKILHRYFNYLVIRVIYDGEIMIYLNKRTKKDIWKNLYDFPLIESKHRYKQRELLDDPSFILLFKDFTEIKISSSKIYRHKLTHREITACFYFVDIPNTHKAVGFEDFIKTGVGELQSYPVPRLIQQFFADYQEKLMAYPE